MLKLTITESAQVYLAELLAKQEGEVLGIRMFVSSPGTPKAETCIAYCRPDDMKDDDVVREFEGFKTFFEARSVVFLEDAFVDYNADKFGGQLTIKAPNSKMPNVNDDSPLEDRVNYVLYNEVNPSLASHGGEVSLVEITEESVAILRFGGGCQGCSMVDETLKHGVERNLMEKIPELTAVRDVTDHSDSSGAYFKG
ncbi:Fe/S biogenesis protein NfuA [Sinobacterium caligoides]|uniref:Fe/S biogenesis protein NfuA n=1 Tax=Sinobacterium caligoides TaxID=933926 RepID=A0A3N2DJQ2_9GAMM|nr:Fe-S biogenesis protein NfuA [Sinobacterium caligoides]ROS00007.1 Fe/S biogenesis protein NfuA [Sinobacterium caligoides]